MLVIYHRGNDGFKESPEQPSNSNGEKSPKGAKNRGACPWERSYLWHATRNKRAEFSVLLMHVFGSDGWLEAYP